MQLNPNKKKRKKLKKLKKKEKYRRKNIKKKKVTLIYPRIQLWKQGKEQYTGQCFPPPAFRDKFQIHLQYICTCQI